MGLRMIVNLSRQGSPNGRRNPWPSAEMFKRIFDPYLIYTPAVRLSH